MYVSSMSYTVKIAYVDAYHQYHECKCGAENVTVSNHYAMTHQYGAVVD